METQDPNDPPRTWGDAPGWYKVGPLALQNRTCPFARFLRANGATPYQPGASPQVRDPGIAPGTRPRTTPWPHPLQLLQSR
ncbi:MAG: hypothetical protein IPH35_25490 [Rhodoferax sp.]|nr:hypothetical protein [Rhodoferax sp.]